MQPLRIHSKQLKHLAKKYVWWEQPAWALAHPDIFLANVMNLGEWGDILTIRKLLGDEVLRQALQEAPPGYFSYRSWDYWHLKLNLLPIPPLPKREFK